VFSITLAFEVLVSTNVVLTFTKTYLKCYKNGYDDPKGKLLSVEGWVSLLAAIKRSVLLKLDVDEIQLKTAP